jgi:hypothetical protein
MRVRSLSLFRAGMVPALALSLLNTTTLLAEPPEPLPGKAEANTQTVSILPAQQKGLIKVETRGHGEGRVRMSIKNTSQTRLNVVIPPGLIATTVTAQAGGGFGGGGGGAGGGGPQSMGLGSISNQPGAFGHFAEPGSNDKAGLSSVPSAAVSPEPNSVAVPVGQTVSVNVPAVCLNYGDPTPTVRDFFHIVDVEQYTADPRARKALRSLASYGTSLGVAQTVAWHAFNNMALADIAVQAPRFKFINQYEIDIAARFIDALDASRSDELVSAASLAQNCIFLQIRGTGAMKSKVDQIAMDLEGQRFFGLPIRVVGVNQTVELPGPALFLAVSLNSGKDDQPAGQVAVRHVRFGGSVQPLGLLKLKDLPTASILDADSLARSVENTIISKMVASKSAKKLQNATMVQIENWLPLTISNIVVRTGDSAGAPQTELKGLGVGPRRSLQIPVEAEAASVVRVTFNGL